MLMSMRNINRSCRKTCCKDCMQGQGNAKGRKSNRRHIKRSERNKWKRDYSLQSAQAQNSLNVPLKHLDKPINLRQIINMSKSPNVFKIQIVDLLQGVLEDQKDIWFRGENGWTIKQSHELDYLDLIQRKIEDVSWEWLDDFAEGQREPVLVRRVGKTWHLMNGHHRLAAAMLLGWDELDAIRENGDDSWRFTSDVNRSTWKKRGPMVSDSIS